MERKPGNAERSAMEQMGARSTRPCVREWDKRRGFGAREGCGRANGDLREMRKKFCGKHGEESADSCGERGEAQGLCRKFGREIADKREERGEEICVKYGEAQGKRGKAQGLCGECGEESADNCGERREAQELCRKFGKEIADNREERREAQGEVCCESGRESLGAYIRRMADRAGCAALDVPSVVRGKAYGDERLAFAAELLRRLGRWRADVALLNRAQIRSAVRDSFFCEFRVYEKRCDSWFALEDKKQCLMRALDAAMLAYAGLGERDRMVLRQVYLLEGKSAAFRRSSGLSDVGFHKLCKAALVHFAERLG